MRRLLDFLIRERHWFLFLLLETIAFLLIYRNMTYQQSVFISSANIVSGSIASVTGSVTSYLNLGDINKGLTERNGQLEMQVLALQEQLRQLEMQQSAPFSGFKPDSTETFHYQFIMAQVVNNTVTHLSNYLTINKGTKEGVHAEMGVVSERGVVGIVLQASEHYAVVLPLLNPKFRLSAKILGSNYFGSLGWNGRNARYAQLEELPRHVEFEKGDTVVTSGYSATFPAGIIVGTIHDRRRQQENDNFNSLDIELATDFHALDNVRVLINKQQSEQLTLEREVNNNGK